MKFLICTPIFPPLSNCGSDSYILAIMNRLRDLGHECRVFKTERRQYDTIFEQYQFDGYEVYPLESGIAKHIGWSDKVICQLGSSGSAIGIGGMCKKPVYHIAHNTTSLDKISNGKLPVNVIYNSKCTADILNYQHPSIILHPPVGPDKYQTGVNPNESEFITLLGLSKAKGADIFYKLAELFPDKKFLGVKGSYGEQITKDLLNVIIWENSSDVLPAYKRTRILLMPSEFESFGMVAREAMSSGIPVICNDLPALRENCGDAGIYIQPGDIDSWVREIKLLDIKSSYLYRSELCKSRAYNSGMPAQLKALDEFLKIAGDDRNTIH